MKNTKEVKPILSAIYCINQVANKDKDIEKILQYAFNSIFDCNVNLLTLACIGKTKQEIMPEIKKFLSEETNWELNLNE